MSVARLMQMGAAGVPAGGGSGADFAVVTAYQANSITSVDISNSSSMSELNTYSNSTSLNSARRVCIDTTDSTAYVVNYTGKSITSIDLSNTSSLSQLSTLVLSTQLNQVINIALDVANNVAYCIGAGGLTSIDISNRASLSYLHNITSTELATGGAVALDLTNQIAYVCVRSFTGGIVAVDISNPSSLSISSTFLPTNLYSPQDIPTALYL